MGNDLYSPDTGEHIQTTTPQDWMARAGADAPAYNRQTEGCFWRNGAWEVSVSLPDPAKVRQDAKDQRRALVDAITVTTQAGNTFDGDEISQTRMARAIIGLSAQPQSPIPEITWILADNTNKSVTAAELTEALALAGAEQASVWVI
jgi:hypothetical protein